MRQGGIDYLKKHPDAFESEPKFQQVTNTLIEPDTIGTSRNVYGPVQPDSKVYGPVQYDPTDLSQELVKVTPSKKTRYSEVGLPTFTKKEVEANRLRESTKPYWIADSTKPSKGIAKGQTLSKVEVIKSPTPNRTDWSYDDSSGMYTKPTYGSGAGGTSTYSPLTYSEGVKIETAKDKNRKIMAHVARAPATLLTLGMTREFGEKQITEDMTKAYTDIDKDFSFLTGKAKKVATGTGLFFQSPIIYQKAEVNRLEIERKVRELNKIADKIRAKPNTTDDKKNRMINALIENPANKKLIEDFNALGDTTTPLKLLGKSDASGYIKYPVMYAGYAGKTGLYFTPPGQIAFGIGNIGAGSETIQDTTTTKGQKIMGGVQAGFGSLLLYGGASSALRSFSGTSVGSKIGLKASKPMIVTGGATSTAWLKGATYASGLTIGGSLGTLEVVKTYQKTGDKSFALATGAGTTTGFLAGAWGPSLFNYYKSKEAFAGLKLTEAKQVRPGVDKGVVIHTKGGDRVRYFERAQKVEIFKPKTWKYRGRAPGSFFGERYKFVSDPVAGKAAGQKSVDSWVWDMKTQKFILKRVPTKTFPARKGEDITAFQTGGKGAVRPQEFGLGETFRGKKLPGYDAGNVFGGPHATGSLWGGVGKPKQIDPELGASVSNPGISTYFLKQGDKTAVYVGGTPDFSQPGIYYMTSSTGVVNPVKYEYRIKETAAGGKGKAFAFLNPKQEGVLQVTPRTYKPAETEAQFFGTYNPGARAFITISGKKIPYEEGIVSGSGLIGGHGTNLGGVSNFIPSSASSSSTVTAFSSVSVPPIPYSYSGTPTTSSFTYSTTAHSSTKDGESFVVDFPSEKGVTAPSPLSYIPTSSSPSEGPTLPSTPDIYIPVVSIPESPTPNTPSYTPRAPPPVVPEVPIPIVPTDTSKKPPLPVMFRYPGQRDTEKIAYDAYAKNVKKIYVKVNDNPMTRSGAKDIMARVIDNTLSSSGKIKKVRVKPNTKVSSGDGYFELTSNKFREWKQVKGKRKLTPNHFIEFRNKRLDMPGETRGLTVAQFKSQGKLGRPKKKTPFRL